MDGIREGLSMGENRKTSNDAEVPKGAPPNIPADFPVDIQALFALIESLRDTVASQNKIIESRNNAELPAEIKAFVATIASQNKIIDSLNRSKQELAQQNAELLEKISGLAALVASLADRNRKDRSSRSNDSSNSSIPPSASNPSKSTGNLSPKKVDKNYSLRRKTQEKPGRLRGHEGSGMRLKEVSDRSVDLFPEGCAGCSHLASCMQKGRVCDTRYTTDVVFEALQTEYKNWEFQCPNRPGRAVQGAFPQEVTGSKQYGPDIRNFAVLLKNIGFVSYKRMAKLCSALGLDLSTGTLLDICNRFADKCKEVRPMITSLLQSSSTLGVDETGGNINGSKVWHHTTVSEDATLIVAHRNRGQEGTLSSGVMQNFAGTVCHDFWSPYFKLANVLHAMCAAHLERENNKACTDNPTLKWPTLMNDLLHGLERERKKFLLLGLGRIPEEVLLPLLDHYDEILQAGDEEDPVPPAGGKLKNNGEPRKPALSKAQNLLKRYKGYKEEILRFAVDFNVPVSNNRSETSFRFLKVAYNVFGCFRTEKGAADFSMTNSVFDTGRKQGLPPKDIVSKVNKGNYLDLFNNECRAILMANGAIPTLV